MTGLHHSSSSENEVAPEAHRTSVNLEGSGGHSTAVGLEAAHLYTNQYWDWSVRASLTNMLESLTDRSRSTVRVSA
jgi:hypothetical protein